MKKILSILLIFMLSASALVSCGEESQSISVTYILGGGSLPASAPESYEKGNAPNFSRIIPEREHHDFEGWYTDASFVTKFRPSSVSSDHVTIYAKWNAHRFSITYELFGGSGENLVDSYTYGAIIHISGFRPERENYAFGGWYTDAEFKNEKTKIGPTDYGDITLYAKWVEK